MADSIYTLSAEKELYKKLEALFSDWKALIKTKPVITLDGKEYKAIDCFNSDGFYPGYLSSKTKVLFIGREGRYEAGDDRIQSDVKLWNENPADCFSSPFWRHLFYILYGITTGGTVSFEDVPESKDILAKMTESNNYGFALMNISKYANGSENGDKVDRNLINRFLHDSELDKRNFLREEIELLNPDIIITQNIWECGIDNDELEKVFPSKDFYENQSKNKSVAVYDFNLNGRKIKLLDIFHLSSRKSDKDDFYEPIMDALFGKR